MTSSSHRLRAEHHVEALGIGEASPRLSWENRGDGGWRQVRYELQARRGGGLGYHQVAVVSSPDSVLVPWPFAPLASRERAELRVRAFGSDGEAGEWSPPLAVEAGLLDPGDWTASAIAPDWAEDGEADNPPPLLRRTFALDGEVARARLYLTAHGLVEAEVNGVRVGHDELVPGWTVYPQRLRYHTYDVTELVRSGGNVVGARLADGWYRGRLGFGGGTRNVYGDRLALLAQLEVELVDGRSATVVTDTGWRAATGPLVASGLYDGEQHDARAEPVGWSSEVGFDDADWHGVVEVPRDPATLVAPQGPPVRCTQELVPLSVTRLADDVLLVDVGQNIAGRLRLRVDGPAGAEVVVRHAEVLQDGRIYRRPLRDAAATDRYTLRGGGEEVHEPRFTIHGFRYAEIEGWTGPDPAQAVVARVLHTDFERTGWFGCSDERLDRLHENVRWSMRGNMVDIPTDCPQRDERLGWTGDIQVFAPTAAFLYDCSGFLASWLEDLAAEQLPDGTVPWFVPVVPVRDAAWEPIRPGAVWGDAAVLTPWVVWERFADAEVLARQWPSALAWVELVASLSGEDHLWDSGFQLGDWLDPAAPPDDPAAARTDRHLVATAYAAHSAGTLARTARTLGRADDAARLEELAAAIRLAFRGRYVTTASAELRLTSDAPTAYALAIAFGLVEGDERAAAGRRLAALVEEAGHTIATGFAGTNLVSDALSSTGHLEGAYALLLQERCPSWLYAVTMGATTIWERWDSLLPDGTVNPGGMTSFNHYALGAVADWMHRVVAGLSPAAPGYRAVRFAPRPGGGLTWATAAHRSPYGLVSIDWRLDGDALHVAVQVPTGATGTVELPGQEAVAVGPGRHEFTAPSLR